MANAKQYRQLTEIIEGTTAESNLKLSDVVSVQHTDTATGVNTVNKIPFAYSLCIPVAVTPDSTPSGGAYTATCVNYPDFSLTYTDKNGNDHYYIGLKVRVVFTTGINYGSVSGGTYPTLNVNGSGSIPLLAQGLTMGTGAVKSGQTVELTIIPYGNGVAFDADLNTREATTDYTIYTDGIQRENTVTTNSKNMVTSGGVAYAISNEVSARDTAIANAIDIPKDAVLHYSFDEVPDYPDGTAIYYKNKNWGNPSGWYSDNNNTTYSVTDGVAKWTTNNASNCQLSNNINNIAGKLIAIECKTNATNCPLSLIGIEDGTYKTFANEAVSNKWTKIVALIPSTYDNRIILQFQTGNSDKSVEISAIYIGDGSYSTPIIDNANGQWNSVSQSGVAVQGMSGKGFNIPALSSCAVKANFILRPPYTQSLWLYIKSYSTSQYAIDGRKQGNDVNTDEGIVLMSNGGIETGSNNGGLASVATGVISPNVWQHIVISCENINGGNKYTFYKNGVKIKEQNTTAVNIGFGELTVGARYYEPQTVIDAKVEKTIDDLLIFDRALTENEVMALYLNKANTPKYYSWADWKLNQIENAQTRTVETKGGDEETDEEKPIEEEPKEEER